MNEETLFHDALALLRELITIPSFSKEEENTAKAITRFLEERGVTVEQAGYNIIAKNKYFNEDLPTLLLNSHHDTVKPNKSYTLDPFTPVEKDGKLFGLIVNVYKLYLIL